MSNAEHLNPADQQDQDEHLSSSVESHQIDVGAYHVGLVYANALLAAAQSAGKVDDIVAEFDALISEVVNRLPRFVDLLSSEMIAAEEKRAIFDRALKGQISPLLLNFLHVVVEHRRGNCLRAMHRALLDLVDQLRGRVRVHVTTAASLDAAARNNIIAQLRTKLGAEPVIESQVDPALIGGAVFRVGDTVYDGSVASRLNRIRQQMINRSVHEIQSRRDRFSSAAGN
ncbi:MAG: ATP synthase F1 subunit delta [Planctomycetes bacterium]|nr:ATP synthase F1 subunit delta [Planctomycetota bacterium]